MHRKEKIVLSAIDLINEFGIHNLSTKEIARRLGISESTIFKEFPKKNDLVLAVLNQFSLYDNDIFSTAISSIENPKEAILFYIDSYMIYYENYPAITALEPAYDLLRGNVELESAAKRILLTRQGFVRQLIEAAQSAGIIRDDIDSEVIADLFAANWKGICLKWRIKEFNFSLRREIENTTKLLLDVFAYKNV